MKRLSLSIRQSVRLLYLCLVLFLLAVPTAFVWVSLGHLPLWPFLAFLAVFLLLMAFVYRHVLHPIAMVEKVLEEISKGGVDLDTRVLEPAYGLSDLFSRLNLLINNIKDLESKASDAYAMMQAAEMETLQSQINPHFLYNTLDCIRGQAMHYGIRDIEIMTRSLSKIFRYSISNHDSVVQFSEELNNIDSYLLIQQMRFNNKFLIEKEISEETLDCTVPKLILQPLVENAIHHGLETKTGVGHLRIGAFLTESRLVINVKDDGCGIPQARLEEITEALRQEGARPREKGGHTSIGLKNISERIHLLYGPEYGVTVYSAEDAGTHVQLSLPVKKR